MYLEIWSEIGSATWTITLAWSSSPVAPRGDRSAEVLREPADRIEAHALEERCRARLASVRGRELDAVRPGVVEPGVDESAIQPLAAVVREHDPADQVRRPRERDVARR